VNGLTDLVLRFHDAGVECLVIGGMAAVYHGAPIVTRDVDFCAPLTQENIARILAAVEGLHPRHFTRPDLPVIANEPEQLRGFKNLYLRTDVGKIDVLGEVPGVGSYDQIKDRAIVIEVEGVRLRVLDIDTLIAAKTFAGRARDHLAISHLEQIRKRTKPG
jgi:hypothetical protein